MAGAAASGQGVASCQFDGSACTLAQPAAYRCRLPDRSAADHGGQMTNAVPDELVALRRSIDNIDAAIVHMLAERFRCTQQVGQLKARLRMPPADPAREAEQVARLRSLAEGARLDPEFAEKFLAFVIKEVIHHHESLRAPQQMSGDMTGGEA